MAQLVFLDGRSMGNVVVLTSTSTIGRGHDNTVVIAEPTLLEKHAKILYANGQFRLGKSDAKARVSVNGRGVENEVLRHGDIISLGDLTILFSDESPTPPSDFLRSKDKEDVTTSIVQSRQKQFESADDVITTFRKSTALQQHLETLYKIGSALNATLDLEGLLKQLLTILFDVFKPDRVFVLLYDELGTLRVRGQRVSEKTELTGFVRVSRTIINEAMERREAILTQDAQQDARFSLGQSIVDQNIQSAMCVPIIKKDKILGAVHLDTLTSFKNYTGDDLQLMNGISAQAAIAIENVLNYDRSLEYSRKLVTLGEISRRVSSFLSRDMILKEAVANACRLFDCTKCSVLLQDEKGESLLIAHTNCIDPGVCATVKLKPGEGFAGKVFAENKPLLVTDATRVEGARARPYESSSFLIVPIVARAEGIQAGSRPIGVVAVTDKKGRHIFTEDDQEFLTVFAAQVGIALQNARLFERATVDTLTKLFTRQFFFAQYDELFLAHQHGKIPLSLIMIDLDHFKQKNDEFGHQAGDRILSEAGRVVKERVGGAGIPARYGGEEFVVLLPGCTGEKAFALGEDLRRRFEEYVFDTGEQKIKCTISVGVENIQPGDTPQMLLKKADLSMYHAKKTGRNRVVKYDPVEVTGSGRFPAPQVH